MYSHVLFIVYESSPHTCISCTCMRSIYLSNCSRVIHPGGTRILKAGTYDDFGTVGGSFLAIFYFSTMYTKIPLRRVGGNKMTVDTKMQMILKYTLGKYLVGGSFSGKYDFSIL